MPSRKTTKAAFAAVAVMPPIPKYITDQFVTGPMSAELVENISRAFKKALIERALGAEMSHQLGYRRGADRPEDSSNHRNGASAKTVLRGALTSLNTALDDMVLPRDDRRLALGEPLCRAREQSASRGAVPAPG